jgi:hypothetical protein
MLRWVGIVFYLVLALPMLVGGVVVVAAGEPVAGVLLVALGASAGHGAWRAQHPLAARMERFREAPKAGTAKRSRRPPVGHASATLWAGASARRWKR